jgi:hypothetical protein
LWGGEDVLVILSTSPLTSLKGERGSFTLWRRLVYWQGAYGYPRLLITNYVVAPLSAPGALDTAIASGSNAQIVQIAEGTVYSFSVAPTASPYPSVTQLARLACLDSANKAFNLSVPAPISVGGGSGTGIFLSDRVTVDPEYLEVVLEAAVADGCVSAYGNAIAAIVSGILNGPAYPGSSLS